MEEASDNDQNPSKKFLPSWFWSQDKGVKKKRKEKKSVAFNLIQFIFLEYKEEEEENTQTSR
jgi:hypothetical protein